MAKYKNIKGEVGIVISKGYGAGWSTWAIDEEDAERLMFDPQLVDYISDTQNIEAEEIKKILHDLNDDFFSTLDDEDYCGLEVVWIKEGERFYIEEYDGHEILITEDMMFSA